jgi:hypothetical protein
MVEGKGKDVPVLNSLSTVMKTYGEWRYSSALDGGQWSASLPSSFIPAKEPPVHIGYGAGWTPEKRKTLPMPGIKPQLSSP